MGRGLLPAPRSLLLLVILACAPIPATAQIIRPPPDPSDTVTVDPFRVRPPVSPLGAMWRSLLLPGWGQSVLDRRVTGAFFVVFEGISLTMTLKSIHQLGHLERVQNEADPESVERVDAKRQEIQDWAILLAFNHLVAGAEAFVSSMLWDFPDELEVRALSGGRVGAGVRVDFP